MQINATVNSLISATANYDTKDVAFDSDGTTVASKAINFTNPTRMKMTTTQCHQVQQLQLQ